MQVILLENVYHLGNIGDVIDVASGYARNYLFPKKKAVRATQQNRDFFELQRTILEQKNNALREKAKEVATYMSTKTNIEIVRQAREDGKLYGSVNIRDITDAIFVTTGLRITSENVILEQRIKNLGIFDVKIMLHPDVIVGYTINVVRNKN